MTPHTHQTAPTQFVERNGTRYAYRRLGSGAGTPLLFCHRFRGTMDDWDPAVINGFASERPVILFDNAGVGLSSGETPITVQGMAEHVVAFAEALGLERVDVLGFSLGGYVAQAVALEAPKLVRRLVLAGTGPGGGEGIRSAGPEVRPVAGKTDLTVEDFLFLFFSPSSESRAAGRRYWDRLQERVGEREPAVPPQGIQAQVAAITAWTQGIGSAYSRLGEINIPVLVANGSNDIMVPTINSFIMSQRIPNARLIVYPDAGHGFLFQYPEEFVGHALGFLN